MTTDQQALAVASQAVIERANLRTSCLQSEICVSGPCACADDIAGAVIKAYLAALPAQAQAVARPASEYHEDMGCVLWWKFPINEAPYVGGPNDLGFSVDVTVNGEHTRYWVGGWPEYHTHFTPIPMPETPVIAEDREVK